MVIMWKLVVGTSEEGKEQTLKTIGTGHWWPELELLQWQKSQARVER